MTGAWAPGARGAAWRKGERREKIFMESRKMRGRFMA
jgi:hypothetical protein